MTAKDIAVRIAQWLIDGISIPTADIISAVNRMDADGNGDISLRELIEHIKAAMKS